MELVTKQGPCYSNYGMNLLVSHNTPIQEVNLSSLTQDIILRRKSLVACYRKNRTTEVMQLDMHRHVATS